MFSSRSRVSRGWDAICAAVWVVGFSVGVDAAENRSVLVEEWNAALIEAVQKESTPPGLVARNLAILHVAMHDAANTVAPRFERLLVRDVAAEEGNVTLAVMSSAHQVCTRLYPSRATAFDGLFLRHREAVAVASGDPAAEVGRRVADAILESRKDDGASRTVHYVPESAPGSWRRTTNNRPPELPQWPSVRPFCMSRADQFRPPPPPALDSPEYAQELRRVREWGGKNSAKRTEKQTETAQFWADFTYTSSPPGHWNEIARSAIDERGMDLHEKARVFALLNLALADAGIAAFDCKYHYNAWRPLTAIGEAARDGNAVTVEDRAWESFLPNPSHPEYVSAHSTFSAAAATVLEKLLGGECIFTVTSIDLPGVIREYGDFWSCAEEVGESRVYGGIHFPYANREGRALGKKIAHLVLERHAGTAGEERGEVRQTLRQPREGKIAFPRGGS